MPENNYDISNFSSNLLQHCLCIAESVRRKGGRAFLVGGCVRDTILKLTPKDIDIEVFGLSFDDLEEVLTEQYQINLVGRSFGVIKISGLDIDVSLPRRESKSGLGHQAFAIEGDPHMSHEDAASRRDFTINAISWDPLTGEIIDPFHGQSDLINGILRHTSEKFSEDPLRVLRAMQFLARFDLKVATPTMKLCSEITPEGLSPERLFEEWSKLILRGTLPSRGLQFLKECGWVKYYPELEALIDCAQDPEWHPEGDAWVHTLHCMDAFVAERINDDWEDLVVGFAVLCHDLGKPVTSFVSEDGHIRSPGHDKAGVDITNRFLDRITQHKDLIKSVLPLVQCHMQALDLYRNKASDTAIRRLARRVGRIDRLIRVDSADRQGRPNTFGDDPSPQGEWLLARAEILAVIDSAPKPIVMGRHLIDAGLEPGLHFKKILNDCFEAQINGTFNDLENGLEYLGSLLKE